MMFPLFSCAPQRAQVAKDLAVEGLSLYWHEDRDAAHGPDDSGGGARGGSAAPLDPTLMTAQAAARGDLEGLPAHAEEAEAGSEGIVLVRAHGDAAGVGEGDLVLLPLSCLLRLTLEAGVPTLRFL